jgi:putative Ca2+/H+ antiporter (TMEM165/GDT1 family)
MPPHAWRVRRGSNTPDPDRRGAARDCRAPEFFLVVALAEMGDKTQLVAL